MMLPTKKHCAKCKVTKNFIEFYKNRSTADGYQAYCKPCKNLIDKKPRTEEIRAKDRERYKRRISTAEGKKKLLAASTRYKQSEHGKLAAWTRYLQKVYSIDSTTYMHLLELQNGGCAICQVKPNNRRLHVDHHHKSKKIRGLLCGKCNQAIGLLNEDLRLFDTAKKYLECENEAISRVIKNNFGERENT
jgi:Recombination endonuclease VII